MPNIGFRLIASHRMELLAWLEQTELSLWLRESDWGHPIVLCFHAVGMALVVGISLMFSARVLGYSKDFPLAAFDKLFVELMIRHHQGTIDIVVKETAGGTNPRARELAGKIAISQQNEVTELKNVGGV